jgi:membrane protein required for colicin V production
VNELDYAVIILMVISIGIGIFRGAIREVINIVGWVLAFILAHTFAAPLAAYFADWMVEPTYRLALSWLAIFLLVLVVAGLLASLISEIVRKLGLSGLDRMLGGVIGVFRGGLILIALTLVAGMSKFPQSTLWRNAASTPWLETVALHARSLLPESLAARINYRQPKQQAAYAPAI